MFRKAALVFLALSVVGLVGWVAVKFIRPIFGIGQDGFFLLTQVALHFVIALCLIELAFQYKKNN